MADIIQIRGGLSTEASATNPVLASRELAFETDTKKGKIGDGVTAYNSLPYSWTGEVFIDSLNSSTVKTLPADGDKIAVSDSEASGALKHYTWAGMRARLKTYFDTIYSITVGTVTSVGASVPTGLSISGSPITSSGVLAISFTAGYSIPTTANQTNWGTAYTHSQVVTGSVHGSTAVGEALLRLANPSAIRFLRINADNTATALTAADFLIAIGAASSSHTHVAANITDFNTAALSAAPAETVTTVGSLINSSTDKATPVDADLIAIRNTTGGLLAKVTWANIKATLKTYFDTLYGYLGVPQNSQSVAYTLVLADAGKHILHPSADTTARIWTIPANASVAFPIGTAITFVNQNSGGVITISITTDTMRLAGAGTTGSRTLAANGVATALKVTSTEWIISGVNLT